MFIANLEKEEWESYERVRHPRFEKTDQIHMCRMSGEKGHKVTCLSARLGIKGQHEICLKNFLVLYGVESEIVKNFDLAHFLNSLKNNGWEIVSANSAKKIHEQVFWLDWKRFNCSNCSLPVLVFTLNYNYPGNKQMEVFEKNPWCHIQASKDYGFLRPYEVKTKSEPHLAEELRPEKAGEMLTCKTVVALTRAGLSLASGIPTFGGPEGLCTRLRMFQRTFPDDFFHLLIERPRFIAYQVAAFQAGFIKAKPNLAHTALANLERKGFVKQIITENLDALHHRVGSTKVMEIGTTDEFRRHFSKGKDGWETLRTADSLIVIGVGHDEHGLIEYARDNGANVFAVGPNRPSFLTAKDFYLRGMAEDVLPQLEEILTYSTYVKDTLGH